MIHQHLFCCLITLKIIDLWITVRYNIRSWIEKNSGVITQILKEHIDGYRLRQCKMPWQ